MDAIQVISQDVFDKVRSRFQNLQMGNDAGGVTIDPLEARFFDFDFIHEGVYLGRVSVSLGDPGSLKVFYSQGITEGQSDNIRHIWYRFLKEMRLFAKRRMLRFDTRDITKSNLEQKDFQYLAKSKKGANKKDEIMKNMNESRWDSSRSTKKTSRAVRGTTEVIVRHNEAVDEMYPGARSQPRKIKAIFIQNHDGERFKYPFIHPAGAFAMAQHVDHGGVPHDPAGKAIIRMSEQIAQLQEFGRHVRTASLHDDATGITERATVRLQELKNKINALGKRRPYEAWMTEFQDSSSELPILDAVTMEEYKQKFTQTNFKEEIAKFFPLLHSIMSEDNQIDLSEYTSEDTSNLSTSEYKQESKNEFSQFEEWAEATEQGKLTDDQIEQMKKAIEEIQPGTLTLQHDGILAWEFFNNLGIEDESLKEKFKEMADIDDSTDPMEVFQAWAKEEYPELLVALGMSGTAQPEPTDENDDMSWTNSTMPNEGKKNHSSMVKEIAGIVKQYYNEDNENVGPFRGHEGIAIEVEKKISEKYGDQAGKQAGNIAKQFMEKLTRAWEAKHGPVPGPVDQEDGLSVNRLKELVGNVKKKLESYAGDAITATHGRFPPEEEMSEWKDVERSQYINAWKKYIDKSPKMTSIIAGYLNDAGYETDEVLTDNDVESIMQHVIIIGKKHDVNIDYKQLLTFFINVGMYIPYSDRPNVGDDDDYTDRSMRKGEMGDYVSEQSPRKDGQYEFETVIGNPVDGDENTPEEIKVSVTYDVSGKHIPATWGPRGGDPAENQEVDIATVYDATTGEEISDNLTPFTIDNLSDQAWHHYQQTANEDSMLESLKKLSGIR
jgi:hypothetical protein